MYMTGQEIELWRLQRENTWKSPIGGCKSQNVCQVCMCFSYGLYPQEPWKNSVPISAPSEVAFLDASLCPPLPSLLAPFPP